MVIRKMQVMVSRYYGNACTISKSTAAARARAQAATERPGVDRFHRFQVLVMRAADPHG